MSVAALLAAAPVGRPGGKCTIGAALATLNDDDRAAMGAAIADRSYTAKFLASVLSEAAGVTVGAQPMTRHRRRDCMCP